MTRTAIPVTHQADSDIAPVREMVSACMQCGTCSASCPNAEAMDMTPRRMWRLTLLGQQDKVFDSTTFWMCSNCYSCSLRCPRGLPLTRAMNALKRIAAQHGDKGLARKGAFYHTFMDNVRRHGRVQETELMQRWMMTMKSPALALQFAPLGLKLMGKGKVHLTAPASSQEGRLEPLFQKAAEMEGRHE
ncbi:4Fe-4S dicluster domain-containing protein [Desulfovibrio ferrophilus]|uniref:Putative heterodisulfide reductase, C subunit n=1 Tax=Desulfovibrio ferrophilus TaxID=241368 RepID=A0A2Z6B113_9BACT|nr:4Fe-4S dicluster domain-containing protein [Desulfovibrio ferrophilus]BBD09217.1 putative heterodisulfide reductase, C subunit [Desulfovibrio ferrophilus]